jgi:hypothetical protein
MCLYFIITMHIHSLFFLVLFVKFILWCFFFQLLYTLRVCMSAIFFYVYMHIKGIYLRFGKLTKLKKVVSDI